MYAKPKTLPLKSMTVVLLLCWSVVIAASAAWNVRQHEEEVRTIMLKIGQTAIEQGLLVLRWYALHGEVYVPTDRETEAASHPFPWNTEPHNMPEPTGRSLSLLDPPQMFNELSRLSRETVRIDLRLVSIEPLNPRNRADSWEAAALRLAGKGADRSAEFQHYADNRGSLRIFRPLRAERSCLRCHSQLGYREQDVIGGISAELPVVHFSRNGTSHHRSMVIGHVAIWCLGALGIVMGYASLHRKETARHLAEQQMLKLASFDRLTGLANRNLFIDRLTQTLAEAERYRSKFGLLYLDLDRFKPINDEFGHQAGDQALQWVAERLLLSVRKSDTVARFGGDEFVIIMHELSTKQEMAVVAQKIAAALEVPFTFNGKEIRVGSSIGISCYPEDGETLDELILQADAAMYRAKSGTSGSFEFA